MPLLLLPVLQGGHPTRGPLSHRALESSSGPKSEQEGAVELTSQRLRQTALIGSGKVDR